MDDTATMQILHRLHQLPHIRLGYPLPPSLPPFLPSAKSALGLLLEDLVKFPSRGELENEVAALDIMKVAIQTENVGVPQPREGGREGREGG